MPAILLILAVVALAGCGSSGSVSDGEANLLTKSQADKALLTLENLGKGYKETEPDEDDDSDMGCLNAVEDADTRDAGTKAETEFEFDGELGTPTVSSQVASYERTGDASEALEKFRDALDGCTKVDETDEDGTRIQVKLKLDEQKSTSDADEQVNLVATGTAGSEGLDFPIGIWFSVARYDNHVTIVGVTDLGAGGGALIDDYMNIAVDRLVAVAVDEEPDADAVAEAPTGGEGPEDSDGATDGKGTDEELPLDGGTYTWASGVTMKLSVEKVQPWGDTDDFCGDGSCGIANPNDTRLVLKYEVTVPKDYEGPFDPYGCPGDLHTTSGNDDEALSEVSGDYERELGGKVFPGATKFGIGEFYIEKAYAAKDFYIESYCGDPDQGEPAYFSGPIKDVN